MCILTFVGSVGTISPTNKREKKQEVKSCSLYQSNSENVVYILILTLTAMSCPKQYLRFNGVGNAD